IATSQDSDAGPLLTASCQQRRRGRPLVTPVCQEANDRMHMRRSILTLAIATLAHGCASLECTVLEHYGVELSLVELGAPSDEPITIRYTVDGGRPVEIVDTRGRGGEPGRRRVRVADALLARPRARRHLLDRRDPRARLRPHRHR